MRIAFALVLLPLFAACGGATTAVEGSDAGSDAGYDVIVPPGPPPNGEIPEKHHPSPSSCPRDRAPVIPSADAGPPNPFDSGIPGGCTIDADCTQGNNGRCTPVGGWGARQCSYDECFVDSDCGVHGVCECGAVFNGQRTQANHCSRSGDCTTDGDCGPGGYCSPSVKENMQCQLGPAPAGYFCHTPHDQCVNDRDCTGTAGNFCVFAPERGIWVCASIPICAG